MGRSRERWGEEWGHGGRYRRPTHQSYRGYQDYREFDEYWEERDDRDGRGGRRRGGLGRALGLTMASALVWGVAHLYSGRRVTGFFLAALSLSMFGALGTGVVVFIRNPGYREDLIQYAVRPEALAAIGVGLLVAALVWSIVLIRSYLLARPENMPRWMGAIGGFVVIALCMSVTTPLVYAAHTAYTQRDLVNSVFPADGSETQAIDKENPWEGKPRVNILLLGGDAAGNRIGVRTDSMTVASIDTKTGDTVLFSLPRNLENAPMPGPLRRRFPNGFQGDNPNAPALLNEVWQYAEEHPDLQPGTARGQRGPRMLKAVIGQILGLKVDNYILVDMFGFAGIIDAIGGVKLTVEKPIPFGQEGGVIQPGTRKLRGKEAMWYGRSRSDGSDYTRMSRQKCLLQAIAKQADPTTVLTKFNRLATATKRAMATDIPKDLLPPLIELSAKVKEGANIRSLQFVPPIVNPAVPNFRYIRLKVDNAVAPAAGAGQAQGQASAAPQEPGQGSGAATGQRKRRSQRASALDLNCPT